MDQERWPGIYTSTVGLIFLGTPFRGTAELQHEQLLRDIQKLFPHEQIMLRNNSASKEGNLWLEGIHKSFCQALAGRPNLKVACFWETVPTDLLLSVRKMVSMIPPKHSLNSLLITLQLNTGSDKLDDELFSSKRLSPEETRITLHVNQTSACLDPIRANIRSYSRDCNYLSMNKFKSRVCKDWKTFVEVLKNMYLQHEEITRILLDVLSFPGMNGRFSQLEEPLKGTYDWIMDEASNLPTFGDLPCPFPAWLRTQGGSFLILGKAGSGKSTLMKHIIWHKQTDILLDQWANSLGCRLVRANFFFSRAGGSWESSRRGMVRSLLHQILSELPEWTSSLFSMRFTPQTADPSAPSSSDWRDEELFGAFSGLADQAYATNVYLCIFLDGLDEHKDSSEHEALVNDLAILLRSKNIKICATSRPRDLVKARLGRDGQRVVLEEHTGRELLQFIAEGLNKRLNFRQLAMSNRAGVQNLIKEIQTKADGIFLWVVLAVKELHRGLGQHGNSREVQLIDLQRWLEHLPDSLREFIKRIIDNTDEYYRGLWLDYCSCCSSMGDQYLPLPPTSSTKISEIQVSRQPLNHWSKTKSLILIDAGRGLCNNGALI